jgi:hypothetical protein
MLAYRLLYRTLWCGISLITLPSLSTGLTQKKIARNRFFRQTLTQLDKPSCFVGLQVTPLIGGPGWLPVHVKVVLETEGCEHKWDFVPLKPSEPATLSQLVQFQAVPGEIRYLVSPMMDMDNSKVRGTDNNDIGPSSAGTSTRREEPSIGLAREFCTLYPDRNMHLVTNNCWTFAFQLYSFLLEKHEDIVASGVP